MRHRYPIFALLFFLISCNQKQEINYYFKEYDTEGWLIPVCIGKETYDFLFDTGSSHSCINQEVAQKIKIRTIGSKLVYTEKYKKILRHDLAEELTFNIASTPISTSFHVSEHNIIGMDIIQKYHWEFDRFNKTFQLQKRAILIKKNPSDIIYKRKYRFNDMKVQVPTVDLLINDTISIPLLFDSGDAHTYSFKDNNKEHIARISPIIRLKYYDNMNDNNFLRYTYDIHGYDAVLHYMDSKTFLWLDSIAIDNLSPSSLYATIEVDSIYKTTQKQKFIGALTWHFISQFRTFYIDPEKQEFTFIVSPQDSNIIRRVDIGDVDRLKKNRKIKFIE